MALLTPCSIPELDGTFRRLELSEKSLINSFIEEFNWTIPLEDLDCHFEICPGSFYGLFDDQGKLISHILINTWNNSTACVGLFVTVKEHRGKGIGKKLFTHIMKQLKDHNVVLTALAHVPQFYAKFGFTASPVGTHHLVNTTSMQPISDYKQGDFDIVEVNEDNFDVAAKYDQSISGIDRHEYMKQWMLAQHCEAAAAVRNGICIGMASFRKDKDYILATPLYAEDSEVAMSLLQTYLKKHGGAKRLILYIAYIEGKMTFVDGLKKCGNVDVQKKADFFMYTKHDVIAQSAHKIFSFSNLETAFF